MALPSFRTWVANTIHTAAELNVDLRDNGKFLLNPPQCRAYHNATQAITTATLTAVALNSERFDRESGAASTMHSTVSNTSRVTPLVAGVYDLKGNIQFAAQATAAGYRAVYLRLNGTTYIAGMMVPTTTVFNAVPIPLSVATTYEFNGSTDYGELVVLHTAGVNLNVEASTGHQCELTVIRVG
ncbi:MAG TPA: hypothetical protein VF244_10420 [Acidimicrobiales bacterium]